MDEANNIYVALIRLLKLSETRIVLMNDIDDVCNTFEIYKFKEEVVSILRKLIVVGTVGTVAYDFSEPDMA